MPWFLVATLVALAALLLILLAAARVRRLQLVAQVAQGGTVRATSSIPCGLVVHGTSKLLGFEPDTLHHLDVDLVLTEARFAVVCGRGLLVDARLDGARLTSARCTGPARLVLEGDVPSPHALTPKLRLELTVADAQDWATALAPWCKGNELPFTSFSPG